MVAAPQSAQQTAECPTDRGWPIRRHIICLQQKQQGGSTMPCKPACRASTPEAVSTPQPTHRVLVVLVALPLHHNAQPVGHVLDALRASQRAGGRQRRVSALHRCNRCRQSDHGSSAARCPLPAAIQLQCDCIAALRHQRRTARLKCCQLMWRAVKCHTPTCWLPSGCRLLRCCICMTACDARCL